jgi:prefoldin subunit 5
MAVTAQRIVLTSPWKLGLFVFLLVAGTGFGLLYAYIELFGDQLKEVVSNAQSLDERITLTGSLTIRQAYMVLGAIAVLSLTGYLAVVSSARPIDRVVRGSRKREQVLKRLEGVQDPRSVDPEDFDDEPAIARAIGRWSVDAQRANDLQLEAAAHREAIAALIAQFREAREGEIALQSPGEDPALHALVDSINDFVREIAEATSDKGQDVDLASIGHAVRGLSDAEGELSGFVGSVAERAGRIAQVAQRMAQSDASGVVRTSPNLFESAQRTGQRLHALRAALEELAEQANKLAITMALQLNRLGDAGSEMIESVEDVRAISTRYQRLVNDLKLCEAEHAGTLQSLQSVASHPADGPSLDALQQEAMVLDQNAEALREVLAQLRRPLASLRSAVGEPEPVPVTHRAAPVPHDAAPLHSAPAPRAAEASAGERIYEIAELGGHRIDEDVVYDLVEFGAVRL